MLPLLLVTRDGYPCSPELLPRLEAACLPGLSAGGRAPRVVLDKRLGVRGLVHDHVAISPLHDPLELIRFVTGREQEPVVLGANPLVLLKRHLDGDVADLLTTALAEELHQPVRFQAGRLILEPADALVDLANQRLVSRL